MRGRVARSALLASLVGALGAAFFTRGVAADPLAAELTYPGAGASISDPKQPFRWTTISSAQSYVLVVGTAAGLSDVWMSGDLAQTSVTVPVNLPAGRFLYARVWTRVQGILRHSADVSFKVVALVPTPSATPTSTATPTPTASPATPTPTPTPTPTVTPTPTLTPAVPPASTPTATPTPTPTLTNLRSVVAGPHRAVSPRGSVSGDPAVIYPASGDGDVNFGIPFAWPEAPGATSYFLRVGTAPGASDVFDSGEIPRATVFVPQLPAGSYFGRIGTNIAGVWSLADFSFGSTGSLVASLVSPVSGSVLPGGPTTFAWQAIPNATGYRLLVGTAFGSSNVLDSGVLSSNSFEMPSLSSGTPLYARVYTLKWGAWRSSDAVYSAGVSYIPEILSPADGAANVDTGLPFEWQPSAFSTTFRLEIGSYPGGNDLHDSGEVAVLKRFVGALPVGKPLYGRISARFGDVWVPFDFRFTVRSNGSATPHVVAAALWATDFVRGMADDGNVPYPDTALSVYLKAAGRGGASCTDYTAVLAQILPQMNVTNPARWLNVCLKPNFYDCHTLLEFQDPSTGGWMLLDPTFDLTVRRASDRQWATAWDVADATRRFRFSDVDYVFLGPRGDFFARNYYLDYPLLYLNVYQDGANMDPALAASSLPYLDLVALPLVSPGPYVLKGALEDQIQVVIDGFPSLLMADPVDGLSYVFWASSIADTPGITVYRPHRSVF